MPGPARTRAHERSSAPEWRTTIPAAPSAGFGDVWLWDAFFAGAAVVTAVLVAVDDGSTVAKIGAVALVLALGAGWFTRGRRIGTGHAGGGDVYIIALVLGLVGAVLLVPDATWALFVVLPQAFWVLRLARAVAVTVVLTPGLPVFASLVHGDSLTDAVTDQLPQGMFLTGFGLLVGIWIHRVTDESDERARLITELEGSRARVAELSHSAGVAAERERLAGEIHDTLAQGFTSIVTLLQAAQTELDTDEEAARRHVALAVRAARDNLAEARTLVAANEPSPLAGTSLADAIARHIERLTEEGGPPTTVAVTGTPQRLPAEYEVVLFRAAQELLANVSRHAAASRASCRLELAGPVTLSVSDDGRGFDPAQVRAGSFGLTMMRGRVERLGGALTVTSAPDAGTSVLVTLPAVP